MTVTLQTGMKVSGTSEHMKRFTLWRKNENYKLIVSKLDKKYLYINYKDLPWDTTYVYYPGAFERMTTDDGFELVHQENKVLVIDKIWDITDWDRMKETIFTIPGKIVKKIVKKSTEFYLEYDNNFEILYYVIPCGFRGESWITDIQPEFLKNFLVKFKIYESPNGALGESTCLLFSLNKNIQTIKIKYVRTGKFGGVKKKKVGETILTKIGDYTWRREDIETEIENS